MAALTTADNGAVANAPVSVWDIGRGGRPGGGAVAVGVIVCDLDLLRLGVMRSMVMVVIGGGHGTIEPNGCSSTDR